MSDGYLLKGGTIVDGTGAPAISGDVLLREGNIKEISRGSIEANAEIVDCAGKVVAPGFVDLHSHMDFLAAEGDQRAFDSFTRQGVTSFVGGNCGFSSFAYAPDSPHQGLLKQGLFKDDAGRGRYESFMDQIANSGVKSKVISLAGHGTARTSLSGFEARDLSTDEHNRLLKLLDEAMDDGAAGVSLGLQYKPGIFASRDELASVATLVKRHDKLLTVHARAYSNFSGTYPMNPFGRDHNLRAIEDMLNLARETGVRLQFSHLILVGSRTWANVDEVIALFDEAIAEGVDVKFDMFSYPCGATLLNTFLSEWFMAKMPGSLSNPLDLLKIRAEAFAGFKIVGFGFGDMQMTAANCSEYERYDNLFIPDIARAVGKSSFATVIDILKCSNAEARVLNHSYYSQEVIEKLMTHPAAIFATDAWSEPGGTANPAAYGNFPHFLELARDKKLLGLEDAVHRMTGAAAARLSDSSAGELREGRAADITVFDPLTIKAGDATKNPQAAPTGIAHVFVDGDKLLFDGDIVH